MSTAPKLRTGRASFWNPENIAQLLTMRQEGKGNVEIGRALGITEFSVNAKVSELRAAGVPIPKRPTGCPAGYKYAPQYKTPREIDATASSRRSETRGQVQARAQALMRFWHRKGHPQVTAWVVCEGSDRGGDTVYSLRSNLVNGLPPKQHPAIRQPNAAE